jgi:hypothetical protein
MKQKTFFYLSIFLLGIAASSVQAQSHTLNIIRWSGGESSVGVGAIDKITFTENDLVVNYNEGNSESIDMLSVRKMTFGSNSGDNNETVGLNDKISVSAISGNRLILNNLPEGNHPVSIYSVSGILLKNATVHSGSPVIDIHSIGKGVYIIVVNSQALKFIRQ